MNRKIIGVTVGTTLSPQKMKEKLNPVLSVNGVKPDELGNVESAFTFEGLTEEQKASLKGDNGKDGYTPQKGVDYFDGKDGKDGYTPIKGVDYFDGTDGKDGAQGVRGTGILKVTTTPTSYTTATGGKNPIKRMAISTVKSQAKVDEVVVNDHILHGSYLYHVYYLDATYVYMDSYTYIKGATGSKGADGYTPVKGTDYYTEADKTEMVNLVLAALPTWNGGAY